MARIVVSGITEERDALEAIALGADALAFVLSESSARCISPREAGRIALRLPPLLVRVGVFIDESAGRAAEAIWAAGSQVLQFEGGEPPDFCRKFSQPWIKSFALTPAFDPVVLARYGCTTYRLAVGPGAVSGACWDAAAEASRFGRIILGGALAAKDLPEALARARPYAVEASESVEFAPGKIDIDRLEEFVLAARGAARGSGHA